MNNRILFAISVSLLLLFSQAHDTSAQDLVTPGQILLFPPSVRSCGMGMTGVADMNDPANTHFNPALYLKAPGLTLSGQIGEVMPVFESDASFMSVGLSGIYGAFTKGSHDLYITGHIRYDRLDYGEITEFTAEEEPFTYHAVEQDLRVTVAGGLTVSDTYYAGLGVSIKPIWSSGYEADYFGDLDYGKVAFDLGLLFAWDVVDDDGYLIRPSFGLSLLNLGTEIEAGDYRHRLPKNGRFGLGLRMETPGSETWQEWSGTGASFFTLSSSFDIVYDWGDRLQHNYVFGLLPVYYGTSWHYESDEFAYLFGVEMGLMEILFLRWGHFESKYAPENNDMYGIGIGMAYERFSCRLDWARIPQTEIPIFDTETQMFMGTTEDSVDRYGITLGMIL